MRAVFYTFLFALLLTSCTNHEARINESFNNYKTAILNNEGAEAVKYTHGDTKGLFTYILHETKYADSSEVVTYAVKDKFMILLIRQLCTKDEILNFDTNTLKAFLINKWSTGKNKIKSLTIGDVTINEDHATAQIFSDNQKTPYSVNFYNEEDVWKIDLSPMYTPLSRGFRDIIKNSGIEVNDYLLKTVKKFSGQDVKKDIWRKVTKKRRIVIPKSALESQS